MDEEVARTWVGDSLTIEFPVGVVGLIRCVSIPGQSPGPTDWACAVVIKPNGVYQIKILNGSRGPTYKEVKQLKHYFKSLGYTGTWNRHKLDKPPKTVVIK